MNNPSFTSFPHSDIRTWPRFIAEDTRWCTIHQWLFSAVSLSDNGSSWSSTSSSPVSRPGSLGFLLSLLFKSIYFLNLKLIEISGGVSAKKYGFVKPNFWQGYVSYTCTCKTLPVRHSKGKNCFEWSFQNKMKYCVTVQPKQFIFSFQLKYPLFKKNNQPSFCFETCDNFLFGFSWKLLK